MLVNSTSIICMIIGFIFLESYSIISNSCNDIYSVNSNIDIVCMYEEKSVYACYPKIVNISTCDHQYNNKNYASYNGSIYIVNPGDTLFYIGWITGSNYLDLAEQNNIKDINVLKIGQVLRVQNNVISLYPIRYARKVIYFLERYFSNTKKIVFYFYKKCLFVQKNKNIFVEIDSGQFNNITSSTNVTSTKLTTFNRWSWPTYGTIINTFSDTERGNKGIDISGVLGQPVLAATNGRVVYVGNILQGYGNLIIIKHDNNYLSAYAHNDTVLVTEQQYVKVGDKIATMGNSGTNEVKLHFEIRHEGKSVDPLYFLPKI